MNCVGCPGVGPARDVPAGWVFELAAERVEVEDVSVLAGEFV